MPPNLLLFPKWFSWAPVPYTQLPINISNQMPSRHLKLQMEMDSSPAYLTPSRPLFPMLPLWWMAPPHTQRPETVTWSLPSAPPLSTPTFNLSSSPIKCRYLLILSPLPCLSSIMALVQTPIFPYLNYLPHSLMGLLAARISHSIPNQSPIMLSDWSFSMTNTLTMLLCLKTTLH